MKLRELQQAMPECDVRRKGRDIEVTAPGRVFYTIDPRHAANGNAQEVADYLRSKIPTVNLKPQS